MNSSYPTNKNALDLLIQQKLNEVEIDASLADKYWPVSQMPLKPGKFKVGKQMILFSVSITLIVLAILWRKPINQNNISKEVVSKENAVTNKILDSAVGQPIIVTSFPNALNKKELAVSKKEVIVTKQHFYSDTIITDKEQSHSISLKTQVLQLSHPFDSSNYILKTPLQKTVDTTILNQIESKKPDTAKKKAPYIIW